MDEVKYPEITVKLVDEDGNAFAVLGTVQRALRQNSVPQEQIDRFMSEVMSGDYDNLLQTCMRWVNVE